MTLNPQFIVDSNGRKKSVLLSIKKFNNIIEYLEDMENIKLYKESKFKNEKSILLEKYLEK
jgi:hypothetical protein